MQGYKEGFREKLLRLVDTLAKDCADHRAAFESGAPFHVEGATQPEAVAAARAYLEFSKQALQSFRQREQEMRNGLRVFKLPAPPLKELELTP